MYKYPEEKRPLIGNPKVALIGLALFVFGGLVVLINVTEKVDVVDGSLNPIGWGIAGVYGLILMVWGTFKGRRQ